jgi:outer membrane protein TolC
MHALAQGVADAEVALAREASRPDRTVEVGYYARSGGRSDMVMFQLAFELPMYAERKQDRALEAKLQLAARAREQRADHLRQLQAELDAAYAEWRLAGERLANLRTVILPQTQSRLEAQQAQHGSGSTGLGAVFEARRALLEARVQELQLLAAQARSRVVLAYYGNEGGHR